jgi:hypothetical protein
MAKIKTIIVEKNMMLRYVFAALTGSILFFYQSVSAQSLSTADQAFVDSCVQKLIAERGLILTPQIQLARSECIGALEKRKSLPYTTANWKVGSSGQLQQFRSHAFTKASGDFLTLAIQFAPPACDFEWNVLFKLPEKNKSTNVLVWTQKIQIDNGRTWQSRLRYPQRLGDEIAKFTQEPVNGYHEILQSMASGNVLHLALEVQGKSFGVEQFSLIGFTASTNQARGMCLGVARQMSGR